MMAARKLGGAARRHCASLCCGCVDCAGADRLGDRPRTGMRVSLAAATTAAATSARRELTDQPID